MANPNQQQAKTDPLPKRCGERVKRARISSEVGAVPPLVSQGVLEPGKGGVEAMALHPWGLAVVFKGEVHVVPTTNVVIVTLAADDA